MLPQDWALQAPERVRRRLYTVRCLSVYFEIKN
jgi:hypothetical protein